MPSGGVRAAAAELSFGCLAPEVGSGSVPRTVESAACSAFISYGDPLQDLSSPGGFFGNEIVDHFYLTSSRAE
jgi:hypothetical protein